MGKYQLSLQGTYSDRLGAIQSQSGGRVSSTECRNRASDVGNQVESSKSNLQIGATNGERVQDGGTQPPRFKPSPPRHSTACCDGLSERREVEKLRLRMQRANVVVPLQNSNSVGHSFRSEDSESLALWEEKEQPASRSSRWMKLTAQSPRWLDAIKLAPWRSSPVHPKSSPNSSRRSFHRKMSNRSLHEPSKLPWFSNTTKKTRNGESQSSRSPHAASAMSRLSGELNPLMDPSAICADETNDDCKQGSFSRLRYTNYTTKEDMQYSYMIASELVPKVKLLVDKPCLVNGVVWELPIEGLPTGVLSAMDALPLQISGECYATNNAQSAGTDVQSSEADMPAFCEKHNSSSDNHASTTPRDTVRAIIVGIPAVSKLSGVEEGDDEAESTKETINGEDKVIFKREETLEDLGVGEMIAETEDDWCIAPNPSSRHSESFPNSPSRRVLRKHQRVKSKSEPLDGLYSKQSKSSTASYSMRNSMSTSHPLPSPWDAIIGRGEFDADPNVLSSMTKSSSDSDSPLEKISGLGSSAAPNPLLSRLGCTAPKSSRSLQLGQKSDSGECCDLPSPRSILCGPDRDSLPSSNPSLRSDPGIVSFSVLTAAESQGYTSTGASFDLNEHDFEEMRASYDLNATAPCKPVESRRVSLSFRDFGPSRPSSEIVAAKVDPKPVETSSTAVISMKLLRCDEQLDKNEPWSSPKPFQSPELWSSPYSTQYHGDESPQSTPKSCIGSERVCPHSAPPPSRLSYAVPSEPEQLNHMPLIVPRSRSRHSEFTSRLGGVFSPLRLPGNNRSCFEAQVLSPPHDLEMRSPIYSATVESLSLSASQPSTKLKKSKSSRRRHSSEETPTVMTSMSKAMKKILLKCKISHSKEKCKTDSPVVGSPRPGSFHQ